MQNLWKSLYRLSMRFSRDASGNFSVLFAFAAVPLILLMGLGIDYYRGLSVQARLNQASDAASLAAVNAATAYVKANSLSQSGDDLINSAIVVGKAQGVRVFNANMGVVADEVQTAITPNISLKRATASANGQSVNAFSATVGYSTSIVAAFGPLVGVNSYPVSGSAAATAQYPAYLDIHIVMDNSASMGIGASDQDQAIMQDKTGCTVACHQPWGSPWPANQGTYPQTRAINPPVTLRIDVVRKAVTAELQIIKNLTFPGQVRVALYTFSGDLQTLYPLSSDLDGAIAAANKIDIAAGPNQGGTYSSYALQTLASKLSKAGDGLSTNSRLGDVLLFTDGVQNSENKLADGSGTSGIYGCNAAPNYWIYGSTYCEWGVFEGFDPAYCSPIKSLGYTMYTLDFEYYITSTTYSTDTTRYGFIQNTLMPSIATNLRNCASNPANAVSARSATEFDNALANIVNQAVQSVRLTQ